MTVLADVATALPWLKPDECPGEVERRWEKRRVLPLWQVLVWAGDPEPSWEDNSVIVSCPTLANSGAAGPCAAPAFL